MAAKEKKDDIVNDETVTAEPPKRKRGRPRKTEADGTEAVAKPKKTTRRGKYAWPTLMDKLEDEETAVDYNIKSDFSEISAIRHKKFGIGFVLKVLDVNKIEVVFEENKKVLAQNWE